MVKDIYSGTGSGFRSNLASKPIVFNDNVYFQGRNDTTGHELWKSDGTPEGTVLVKDLKEGTGNSYVESLTIFNDELYFITTSDYLKELFKTDGTDEGTVQLTDIHENNGGVMGPLVEINDKLYFSAGDRDEYGSELWVTDGTESGTEMVVNLNDNATNNGDASVSRLFGDGDLIYFAAEDEHDNGYEPWVYDTTAPVSSTNPQMLMDVYTGQSNGVTGTHSPGFTKAGDSVIFFAQQDSSYDLDLYVTDGTPDGTSLLVDFGTGIGPGDFSGSITFNGEAYFAADIPSPNSQYNCTKDALWKTDGTEEGTVVVASCIVQEGNNNGATFIQTSNQLWSIVGDTLFFRAREYLEAPDEHYPVLWRTDGIPNGSGTYPVDLSYSNERCQLMIDNSNLFVLNNKIYTGQKEMCSTSTDNDYYNGTEIRVHDPTNITFGTPPLKYTFDFKLQVLEQLFPIFPSEDSADLAID